MPIERRSVPGLGVWFSVKSAYTTTGQTLAVSANGAPFVAPIGSVAVDVTASDASDAPRRFGETLRSDGTIAVGSDGTIDLGRATNGTDGLDVVTTMIATQGSDRTFITGYGTILRRVVSYSGTDEAVEVDAGGMPEVRVLGISPVYSGVIDIQDAVLLDEAYDSTTGMVKVPSTGTITLRRVPSGSSGLPLLVWLCSGNTAKIPGLGTLFTRVATYSNTDETVEVDSGGYPNVQVFSMIPTTLPVGTANGSDENLYVNETTDSRGVMNLAGLSSFTIRRQGSGSDGGSTIVNMIGY